MCPGTATKLLCSHYLIHWSGPRCPKKCVLPSHRAFLPCTCAPCDPEFRRTQIQARYAAEREKLLARIRDVVAARRAIKERAAASSPEERRSGMMAEDEWEEVRPLQRHLNALAAAQMQDSGRTRAARLDPAVGCRWPGMYEQWVMDNLGRSVDWDALLNR